MGGASIGQRVVGRLSKAQYVTFAGLGAESDTGLRNLQHSVPADNVPLFGDGNRRAITKHRGANHAGDANSREFVRWSDR